MSQANPNRERPLRASASVVAAGVAAILGGALGAFSSAAALLLFATSAIPGRIPLPPFLRPVLYGLWSFFFLSAVFVAVVGAEAIRLRRWARTAMMVVAACLLFFGVVGIAVILFTIFVAAPDPAVPKAVMAAVLSVVYGIPVAVALWWLVLFSKRSVRAQFEGAAAQPRAPSRSVFNNPRCPLAVRIVGWYLASFALVIPFLPFFPSYLPAFYFGHVFRGPAATALHLLHLVVLSVPGMGLLLLKRWSYPVVSASQVLVCVNALVWAFSRSFDEVVRSVLAQMQLPELPSDALLGYLRYFQLLGLILPVAILATLAASRRSFYAAAGSPAPPGASSSRPEPQVPTS